VLVWSAAAHHSLARGGAARFLGGVVMHVVVRTDKTSAPPYCILGRAGVRVFGLCLCLCLCLLTLAPHARATPETDPTGAEADARAQAHETQPTDSDPAARAAFEAGRAAYDHGRFAEALDQFQLAYELSRLPQLLFNIARAAESDGRNERAVSAYEAYLQALPVADNRDFVEARMRRLRGAELGVVPSNGARAARVPSARETAARDASGEDGSSLPGAPRRDETSARPFYKRGWFWTVVGVGVVAAVTTGVLLANRNRSSPESYDLSIRALRVSE
jgi:hypothetical protein